MSKSIRVSGAVAVAFVVACLVPLFSFADSSNAVVATVGGHNITEKELDTKAKAQLSALQSQMYEVKKQVLQSMADDYLIEQAAKQEHVSKDDFLKKHLATAKVTPDEAKKFYDSRKDLQGRYPKYDDIKDKLVEALQQQRDDQAKEAMLASLRKEHPLNLLLTPPRVEVEVTGDPSQGPKGAPITIVEFSDFQCPFCKRAEPTMKQVREKYGDKIRLVYEDFPLEFHPNSRPAASAARCAAEQGKFWEFHDKLFDDQSKLTPSDLKADAKQLGLDTSKFDQCLDSDKYGKVIEADLAQGKMLGVQGTPAFYINGRPLDGAVPYTSFASIIDEELAGSNQKQARAN